METLGFVVANRKNVGIIISDDDSENCYIALRCAVFHLMQQEFVKIFFVDTGVKWGNNCNQGYEVNDLIKKFKHDGGLVAICVNRDKLKIGLTKFLDKRITEKEIDYICYNQKFGSIRTDRIYVKQFKFKKAFE